MRDILPWIDRIAEISDRYQITALKDQLESIRPLLSRTGVIDVAVLGRFKAGKSSFLNSLAGEAVLPVGVIPVTSVITRLRYGARKAATVIDQKGVRTVVDFSQLSAYISESENPKNRKSVASVEIELPSLKSYEGLEFVDTPGLGSVFEHNTELALDWLPNVGAAIVAIGVDPPLSKHDLDLIERLRRYTPKVVILLTKADLLSEDDRHEVHGFVKRELHERFSIEFPIHFYSTAAKLENLRESLRNTLLAPLVQDKERESERIVCHKVNTLLSECADFLKIALKASEKSQVEREELGRQILGERLSIERTRDELRTMIREWLGRTRPAYMKRLSELQGTLLAAVQDELKTRFQSWDNLNLYRFTRAYEDWMREHCGRMISDISLREQAMFQAPVMNARAGLDRVVQSFQHRLTDNIEEFLGITTERAQFEIAVRAPSTPDISIGRVFDSHLDTLWFLIPMTIFRGIIQRHFLNQLPFEVEKNLSRLASQWTERINVVILDMGRQVERFVTEQVQTLENLLVHTPDPTEAIRELLREVGDYRNQLPEVSL